MEYIALAENYEKLEKISSKLEKTRILAESLRSIHSNLLKRVVLLYQGTVYPAYTQDELGIASQMMIKAIAKASGFSISQVEDVFKKTGDLGLTAEKCVSSKKQSSLLRKRLTIDGVFDNLQKLSSITGEGSQEKKLNILAELIISSKPIEARYITRTVLGELRVGTAEGIIRDAIAQAFLTSEKSNKDDKSDAADAVEYASNIVNDFGEVAKIAKENGIRGLKSVKVKIGNPLRVMLGLATEKISDVVNEFGIVYAEYKYDGARVQCHKNGDDVTVFTRSLENVTKQFPDIVDLVRKGIKADECIVEGEVLGIDKKGNPIPFQSLSQRIQRKYDIDRMAREIPIQVNLFDIVYLNGKELFNNTLKDRKEILQRIVKHIPGKFQIASQIMTSNVAELEKFYQEALRARQEGLFLKVPNSPYVFGRHVGGWYKIKPIMETLDLVIVGAQRGEGARSKWLTSYLIACKDGDTEELLECGMVSTGLTEEQYNELTTKLESMITREEGRMVFVKPKIIIEVGYQEIQKSPTYGSGFALRFPRYIRERTHEKSEPDTLDRVKSLFRSQGKSG